MLLTGDDVARIARTLVVEPWRFTQAVEAAPSDAMGFALDAGTQRYRLALARVQMNDLPAGCTFLVYANGGAARCGLGALRPAPCRSYPSQLSAGVLEYDARACSCDWSGVAVDAMGRDRALLEAEQSAREAEHRLVSAWNAFVAQREDETPLGPRDYCRYLLDRHEARP